MTDEKKIEKFEVLMSEYNRLQTYKHNLERLATGTEAYKYEYEPEQIRKIVQEIKNIEIVLSFINTVVYGDKNIKSSNGEEHQHQVTEESDHKEDSELS